MQHPQRGVQVCTPDWEWRAVRILENERMDAEVRFGADGSE